MDSDDLCEPSKASTVPSVTFEPMNEENDLSRTCRIDLRELTKSISELDKGSASVSSSGSLPPVSESADDTRTLIDLFGDEVRGLRFRNAKLSEVVVSVLGRLNLPATHAHLLAAGKRFGETVDFCTLTQPSYHNQYHVAEVVMAAYILGKRERLPEVRIAEIVVAAAAHDLGHPGKLNSTPFEIEALSYDLSVPILRECAWTEQEIERFRRMLLATDFVNGVPKCRVAYLTARSLPAENEERILATQCVILTEADILFSCFSTEYNEELSKLLSREWNLPTENLSHKQRLGFLNSVVFISEASKQLGLDVRRQVLIALLESEILRNPPAV